MTWSKVSLEEVAEEITVGFVGSMAEEYVEKGVLFFRSLNIEPYRINFNDIRYVSENFHKKIKKSVLHPGDVVIVRTGKPGTCAVIPESIPEANCSDLVIVRPGKSLNSRFLAYYVNSAAAQHVASHLVGAVQQHFNIGSARVMQLDLPPLPEQRAIAHVLGSLDDKIEINRQMNETLEEMARTLFRSWFVDFDPVHAKAEGRQPEGMDAETAALFPSELVESELGMIPKGWEIRSLDKIAEFLNGLALQKYPPREDLTDFPVIKIAQLRKGDTEGSDKANCDVPSAYVIQDGDVLFSWSGSLEVAVWCGGQGALNQHLFKVTSAEFPKWFYLGWVQNHLPEFQSIAASKATTMGHIQRHHLADAKVIVPGSAVMEVADDMIAPIIDQIIQNNLEVRHLREMREDLLPKLISGEVRLPEDMIAEFASGTESA